MDMSIEPYLIASSVVVVIAQRLVRKLCEACKKPYKPSVDVLRSIGLSEKEAEGITFYQPVGCAECLQMGYKGRLAVYELMEMTNGIARLTIERADMARIRVQAIADGMTLLIQDGLRKIKLGLTTIDEVLSVASMEQEVSE
jgi:type II secretory ATPase GspE/PulE/Tfp pilus assembly ATPase PilB-like protein